MSSTARSGQAIPQACRCPDKEGARSQNHAQKLNPPPSLATIAINLALTHTLTPSPAVPVPCEPLAYHPSRARRTLQLPPDQSAAPRTEEASGRVSYRRAPAKLSRRWHEQVRNAVFRDDRVVERPMRNGVGAGGPVAPVTFYTTAPKSPP